MDLDTFIKSTPKNSILIYDKVKKNYSFEPIIKDFDEKGDAIDEKARKDKIVSLESIVPGIDSFDSNKFKHRFYEVIRIGKTECDHPKNYFSLDNTKLFDVNRCITKRVTHIGESGQSLSCSIIGSDTDLERSRIEVISYSTIYNKATIDEKLKLFRDMISKNAKDLGISDQPELSIKKDDSDLLTGHKISSDFMYFIVRASRRVSEPSII